jgi:hypothetical protein
MSALKYLARVHVGTNATALQLKSQRLGPAETFNSCHSQALAASVLLTPSHPIRFGWFWLGGSPGGMQAHPAGSWEPERTRGEGQPSEEVTGS